MFYGFLKQSVNEKTIYVYANHDFIGILIKNISDKDKIPSGSTFVDN